ncbi:HD domain-containing protein [Lachnospiraceae bacterium JLR.KK008]
MSTKDDNLNISFEKCKSKTGVFRDPIHGLINVYPWERVLIDTREFQRLRKIHQLSMTYLVYHGAEHTRFGHSIGTMHIAGRVMDQLKGFHPLNKLNDEEFFEKKALVRMAALLHDIGHGCYSHVGEGESSVYPKLEDPINGEMVSGHEAYTRCIIKKRLASVIESFWPKEQYHMVEDILLILSQSTNDPKYRFFDDIISGQLDCDKMDYLLRDSHYCGVEYGTYDLEKLIHSMRVAEIEGNHVLAIDQSGIQVVEEFVLARYWMFIQVYFHKDRRLFDYYLSSFIKEYLLLEEDKTGQYPNDLEQYLKLDDSKIDCKIKYYADLHSDITTKRIHDFANRLLYRKHHKVVFNPAYVHYDQKSGDEREDYKRLHFVTKHIKNFIKDDDNLKIFVDLATGSTAKHMFEIKFYNDEQNPDMQSEEESYKQLPAIPVVTKHDDEKRPIQYYSFTLRSISDLKIGILRIYAEDEIAEETRERCQQLYSDEFTRRMDEINKTQVELEATQQREKKLRVKLNEMREEIN